MGPAGAYVGCKSAPRYTRLADSRAEAPCDRRILPQEGESVVKAIVFILSILISGGLFLREPARASLAHDAGSWSFVPLPLPPRDPYIDDVATGPDREMYVVSLGQQYIYRLAASRSVGVTATATRLHTPGFAAEYLVLGADGYLYASDSAAIEVFKGDGTLVRAIAAHGDGFGANLALGPDGNVWACGSWHIEKIDRQGHVTKYRAHFTGNTPNQNQEVVAGPDGKVWFSDAPGNAQTGGFVASIDPSTGKVEHYQLPMGACDETSGMAFGGDRKLYIACFTVGYNPLLAQVSLDGSVRVIPYLAGFATIVNVMTQGVDGIVYFSSADGSLVAYDPFRSTFEEHKPPVSWVRGVTTGPDGRVWAVAEGYGLDIYKPSVREGRAFQQNR